MHALCDNAPVVLREEGSLKPTRSPMGAAAAMGTVWNFLGDGRQNAATRRNMRREERVTVQGPVKEQPDGMSRRGSEGGGGFGWDPPPPWVPRWPPPQAFGLRELT